MVQVHLVGITTVPWSILLFSFNQLNERNGKYHRAANLGFEILSLVALNMLLFFSSWLGVFHLIHTAFDEYVFLVVENQMIVEMDMKLTRSLETHLKKGEFTFETSLHIFLRHGHTESLKRCVV